MHPLIAAAARALMARGHRVTSIYRPEIAAGQHRTGRALDAAFLMYAPGHFNTQVALNFLNLLRNLFPQAAWSVIAEDDHLHIELSARNTYGQKNAFSNYQLEEYHV